MPFFHILEPGSLAPCSAHDFQGGVAKSDISYVLKDLANRKLVDWDFFQSGLKDLRKTLMFSDKNELSVKLPGRKILWLCTMGNKLKNQFE